MKLFWMEAYPDVYKIVQLYEMYDIYYPKQLKYVCLPSLLQIGPKCGLVALAMFTENPTNENVAEILKIAKEHEFTYNGEMFSARNLCELAKHFTKYKASVYDGYLNNNYIKEHLLNGGCMLVPYDSDKNHSPCLNNGFKAHWAAVSGIIETENEIYVLAKHGKSKNVAIWTLESLAQSNSQLNEYPPQSDSIGIEYCFPSGGIAGPAGLCNKSILLTR